MTVEVERGDGWSCDGVERRQIIYWYDLCYMIVCTWVHIVHTYMIGWNELFVFAFSVFVLFFLLHFGVESNLYLNVMITSQEIINNVKNYYHYMCIHVYLQVISKFSLCQNVMLLCISAVYAALLFWMVQNV